MDLLLIMTYAALCIAIFKVFKIPLNKWTVPTAVLGGVILIGTLILLMNYNHPFTQLGSQVFSTTPVVSGVRGRVIEVPVQANQPLKQGDVLFRIDPVPFEAELAKIEAQIKEASQGALGLESNVSEAAAAKVQAIADRDKAQREYARYQRGYDKGAFTEQDLDTRRQAYKAAEAAVEVAQARLNQANISLNSEINGENTTVARLLADFRQAQFNLEQTIVRAPTDGYVTQLALRPGAMSVPLPLAPMMTFVHTEDKIYTAAFRQNSLQRLKPGFEAEFLFRALPGKVFKGEVVEILPVIGESQIQARGTLLGTEALRTNGRVLVTLKITDDLSDYHLPLGTAFEAAIYSDSFSHVSIMRKVLIRMKSWQNYLYIDH
ncbi:MULTISPECIES: HlyD family secretion protein [Vibrio]|uniref:Membrane fusion protein biotin-lipoyl like domain-containing protein n=1 Tax=Vibrio ordalii FS-238 TaxID=617133 RepID=A0A853R265_9VIBR|nr:MULTISPECIES: HlyD family secretion protein [Vibrio]ASG01337.1 HlyD family secretion protein [Vibrio anguillarum]MBT2946567.1 HlyD family secretion protein [Vibrio anguillarum]MBY7667053.1 HlyD family secretion protein [Vibrio anguillarum]MDF9387448.1 HlyD family secretion protein [Vibrio sp. 1151_11]MDQ2164526.1 HlyD family secretion protein [Vibrio anguillarum]